MSSTLPEPTADSDARGAATRAGRGGAAPQVQVVLSPASHADYDDALARAPGLCRPFAAAMGDARPAARCVGEYEVDRAAGLGSRLAGAAGAGLAGALAARFAAAAASAGEGRLAVRRGDGSLL